MIQPIVKTKGGDFELLFDVTEEEFEVAISLRDFHTYVEAEARGLCLKPEVKPVNEVVFCWGAKRRRSANESPVLQSPSTFAQPPPPPPLPPKSDQHDEAPSPSSPFSFSRNDSVESSKLLKRTASYKKRKEELLEITENLTRRNELLAKEIQRKKLDYEQQKLSNIFLKAKKEELSCAPIMSQEPNFVRHPALLHNQFQTHLPITMHHQVPLASNQTAMDLVPDLREILSMRCGNTTSFVNPSSGHTVETAAEAEEEDRGPKARRIPDLNQPLTETLCDDQSYYHQMMVAAQNRQIRMQIWRKKKANKSNSFCR